MPELKSAAAWRKENTTFVGIRLNHHTDADLLAWLNACPSKQGAIRKALRFYLAAHPEETEKH